MDRETLLRRVVLTCRDYIREISYHRAMLPYTDHLRTNIWIYTFNNFINMAVLNWCHLFGNHSDDLHWLNIIEDSNAFKDELLQTIGISFEEWKLYRKTITDYRNKDVAHIEVRPEGTVPQMDNAIIAVCFYYSKALAELKSLGSYTELPNDLEQFNNEVSTLAINYVNAHIVQLFERAE